MVAVDFSDHSLASFRQGGKLGRDLKAELLKAIEKDRPDLLIMGVKGRSNLVERVIGSCAQKMFRRCPIPLLVIR